MFHDIIEMWYVIETICGLHLEGRNYMVLVKKKGKWQWEFMAKGICWVHYGVLEVARSARETPDVLIKQNLYF